MWVLPSGSEASLTGASLEGASVVCPGNFLLLGMGRTLLTCTGELALAALADLLLGCMFKRFLLRRRPRGLLSTGGGAGASS